jgi:hypothetical protein
MVRIVTLPVSDDVLPLHELPVDGHSYSREHVVSRPREARPSQDELDYLQTLALHHQPVTTKGTRWEKK